MRIFYTNYFDLVSGEKYINDKKGFTFYFLTFGNGLSRIELMNRMDITTDYKNRGNILGLAHIAFSVGSKEAVNQLTERLRSDNYTIASEPRTSGDRYYESVVLDPVGNQIEIIA